jgi:hypothetical protein
MVPSVAATAAIGVARAQGALAASFSVAGQSFKVTADRLEGKGFAQYGAIDSGKSLDGSKVERHPVAVSAFREATINGMCQSVLTPTPFGNVSLILKAGGDKNKPVTADNLYIDVADLQADATFSNIDIGVAAQDAGKGPGMKPGEVQQQKANPFGFAQQADSVVLTNVKQTAWATTAGTFKLSGLKMSLATGTKECH